MPKPKSGFKRPPQKAISTPFGISATFIIADAAACRNKRLEIQVITVDARADGFHSVAFAEGKPRGDPPSKLPCLADRLDHRTKIEQKNLRSASRLFLCLYRYIDITILPATKPA